MANTERLINSVAGRLVNVIVRRWLLIANVSILVVLLGSLAVAYLRSIGASWLSEPMSLAYRLLCPQRPSHSYFPFGYQMALEQRLVAMFAAQLVAGLFFGLVRRRARSFNWRFMALFSIPIGLDVVSQMVGFRDSDWQTRTWTGALFNLAFAFWAYPVIEASFRDARLVREPAHT